MRDAKAPSTVPPRGGGVSLMTLLRFAVICLVVALPACERGARTQPEPSPAGSGSGKPGGGGPPLAARGHVAAETKLGSNVTAVGTLSANESVEIVSEVSRRLLKVHVAEGAEVKRGALLFSLDAADIGAELARLGVRKRQLASNEARQRQLLSQNLISQAEYDRGKSELDELVAEMATQGVALRKARIRAPFAGRVGLRRVSVGAWVTPATVLTTLQDSRQLKLDFSLPERYAAEVRVGDEFVLRVGGRAEDFKGRVTAIEPTIDRATRSLSVRGLTDNSSGKLHPGGFANVELSLGAARAALMIPAHALVPNTEGQAVWLLREGKAALVPVEIGRRTADEVEVVRGVVAGDTVLTSNLLRLRPGAPVTLEK